VNDEFERMWKEAVLAEFKALTRHFLGGTEKNHENLSGILDSRPRFKSGTFKIQRRTKHENATFSGGGGGGKVDEACHFSFATKTARKYRITTTQITQNTAPPPRTILINTLI
jgi:hypothetical protein